MKNFFFFAAIILISQTSLLAQKSTTWKGGTPGKPSDWNCASNWSDGRVPNEFSDVTIPNVSIEIYPVIKNNVEDINALFLMSNTHIKIEKKGALTVSERVEIAAGVKIDNLGKLDLPTNEITTNQNISTVMLAKKSK
ncbi:MAG: hypothetical protein RIR11_3433 [Bacteroidota bacterium]